MKNINRKNQLYFDFGRDYEADLDNFFFSSKNSILKSELNEILEGSKNQKLFITGNKADGKTFLLNSFLNHNKIKELQSIYIDVSTLIKNENYLEGLASFDLVCLDNIHKIAPNLEIQIFNLINECKDGITGYDIYDGHLFSRETNLYRLSIITSISFYDKNIFFFFLTI